MRSVIGDVSGSTSSQAVRMTVRWSVLAGESRSIAAAVQGIMASTSTEPGCVGCSLTTEMGARAVINYTEEWSSESELQRQLRSDRFAVLVELMEHASAMPSIEFTLPDSVRGLDYAQEIRRSRRPEFP
jgi:quinol monooxygenase YgiN